MTRKPDDDVGKPGTEPAGEARQTPEQAALTDMSGGGRSDDDRSRDRSSAEGAARRNPVAVGGSSGGHSDQQSASGDGKVASGRYDAEKGRE